MKTVKALTEELDELRFEAKGIYETAKNANRELTEQEAKRFDEITNKDNGLIKAKKSELADAEARERTILEIATRERRQSTLEEIESDLAVNVRRNRVLPTNGRLPEDERGSGRVLARTSRLKCFKSEEDAYNAAMYMRAVVAREYSRGEDQAAVRHCHQIGWEITNAGTEGSGPGGGYLVPTPLANTIIDVREQVGVVRQLFDIQPMTSDTLTIPKVAGGLTVYYPGETQPISPSDPAWGQVGLVVKKRAVGHQISQELSDDAIINVVDNAVREMAYALALKEDNEGIKGDGSGTYGGVQGLLNKLGAGGTVSAATGHDTWPELDVRDFTTAMGKLPDEYAVEPSWLCSRAFYYGVMLGIEAAAGGNAIASLQGGDGGRRMFLGYPVSFSNRMPVSTATNTVCALFGTFSMGAILGDRTGIRIARSDDYAFYNDMISLKATARYDMKIHAGGTATDPGAYVGLATAS